jgi:YggT family protein
MDVVLRQLLLGVAYLLGQLLWLYSIILLVAVVASWLNADPRNFLVSFLRAVTEPVLYQVRRRLPFVVVGGFDLSPLVVFLGIGVLRVVLVDSLVELAHRIGMGGGGLRVG